MTRARPRVLLFVALLAAAGVVRTDGLDLGEPARYVVVTVDNSDFAPSHPPGGTPRGYAASGGYTASAQARRLARNIARRHGLVAAAEWPIEVLSVHCVVFELPVGMQQEEMLGRLRGDPDVETAQPLNTFHTAGAGRGYNDPYVSMQRALPAMRIADAQRWSQGHGVRVAIVDTGVDAGHPELAGRIALVRDFVNEDSGTAGGDRHGTAVAGAVAAAANNGKGIVGVAPDVRLLALKACWHSNGVEQAVCNTLTLAQALAFAMESKARIINLSLTGPADLLLGRLVGQALGRGVVVVGAMPPGGQAHPSFPGDVPGVIIVDNADAGGGDRSVWGAPGTDILSLTPGGNYDFFSGSSISAALVTGAIALMLERDGTLTPAKVHDVLDATSADVPGPGTRLNRTVDACAAVASVIHDICPVRTAETVDSTIVAGSAPPR